MRVHIVGLIVLILLIPILEPIKGQIPNIEENQNIKIDNKYISNKAILPSPIQIDQIIKGSWNDILNKTGIGWLHSSGYMGQGIKIGIIDNGIDFTHDAFENITYQENSFATPGFASTETHGTPVAGVITGYLDGGVNGTAPSAEIYSAEMGSDSTDAVIYGNFTAAAEWMGQNGVDIINTSFGGYYNWTSLINVAKKYGMILVGSAGNDGASLPPSGPGADIYSISVGAISSTQALEIYSSRGPTAEYTQKPDVVGYGQILTINIFEGVNTYAGTSFSSPMVVGGIASLISALNYNNETWNIGKLKSALIKSSMSVLGSDEGIGAGLINFTRAFEIMISNVELAVVTPLGSIVEEYEEIPRGLVETLPLQVLVSDRQNATVEIRGEIQEILFADQISEYTSIPFKLDTRVSEKKLYSGEVAIKINGIEIFNKPVSILVRNELQGVIGVDYYHNDQYIQGQEDLRNTENEWVEILRGKGYWPIYILGEYTDKILENVDILFMKNMFLSGGGIISDEYSSSQLTDDETQVLDRYRTQGGKIFFSFDSVGSDMVQVKKILELSGMGVDQSSSLVRSDHKVYNFTYIGKDTSRLDFEGYNILGGVSVMEGRRGIVISDDGKGKMIATSSDDILSNAELLYNIMDWLVMIEDYKVREVSEIGNLISVKYEGGNYNADKAEIISRYYNGSIYQRVNTEIKVENGLGIIEVEPSDGITDVIIMSNSSDNYLQIEGDEYLELVIDKVKPSMVFIGNASNLLINGTEGEDIERIALQYNDNYGVNITRTLVISNNNSIQYQFNENNKTLWFFITANRFENSDVIKIIIDIYDFKGNMFRIDLQMFIERIEEVIPSGIIERSNVILIASTEEIIIGDENYVKQISQVLLGLLLIITIALFVKWKEMNK